MSRNLEKIILDEDAESEWDNAMERLAKQLDEIKHEAAGTVCEKKEDNKPVLKKKSSIYTGLGNVDSFRKAEKAGEATLDDYDMDRAAEQARVQQMLQNMDNSFTVKEDEPDRQHIEQSKVVQQLPVSLGERLMNKTPEEHTGSTARPEIVVNTNQTPAISARTPLQLSSPVAANQDPSLTANQTVAVLSRAPILLSSPVAANQNPSLTACRTAKLSAASAHQMALFRPTSPAVLARPANQTPTVISANQIPSCNTRLANPTAGFIWNNQLSTVPPIQQGGFTVGQPNPSISQFNIGQMPAAMQSLVPQRQPYNQSSFQQTGSLLSRGSQSNNHSVWHPANQGFCFSAAPTKTYQAPSNSNLCKEMGTAIKFRPPQGQDTVVKNGVTTNINTKHQCITAMQEYEKKSLEELRFEDYIANRRGKQVGFSSSPFDCTVSSTPWSKGFNHGLYSSTRHKDSGLQLIGGEPIQTTLLLHPGIADDSTICDLDLVKKCGRLKCSCFHNVTTNLPYIWQMKVFGVWVSLMEAEKVERAFCDDKHQGVVLLVTNPDFQGRVTLEFVGHEILCLVVDQNQRVEARRLSTMSYTRADCDTDSFRTQWRWYWKDNRGCWILYDKEAMQYTLETKYLAGQEEYLFSVDNDMLQYVIDFNAMVQINMETKTRRVIIRRPLFVSAKEVREGRLPSKLLVPPPVEVPLPKGWAPWDHTTDCELVKLSQDTDTYREIVNKFFSTLDRGEKQIECVYRIQSHVHWHAFCSKEKFMKAALERTRRGEALDKRDLFHGTDSFETVRGILTHNFDQRVSGKNATVFGDGVYFASDASYSDKYTKGRDRYMFVVHVLVGKFTNGKKEYRRPPQLPGSRHILYDSCVDSTRNPSIFILFDKSQHYPAYLIRYKNK